MHKRDPRLQNLVSRLFAYAPRVGRQALEDYCTEGLAWCLLNSPELVSGFLNLTRIAALKHWAEPVNVRTQVRFDGHESEDSDDNPLGGRFDLVLESEGTTPFVVVVESKVGNGCGVDQLKTYRKKIDAPDAFPGIPLGSRYLVTLTTIRHRSPLTDGSNITWAEVFGAIKRTSPSSTLVAGLFIQFADFLDEKGLSMLELKKIKDETLTQWLEVKKLERQLKQIVERLRNQEEVKAVVGRRQVKPVDEDWVGVYGKCGFWAGFGISNERNPHLHMWVEISLPGDQRKLRETFDPELEAAFVGAKPYLQLHSDDESVNLGRVAKSGNSWFVFAKPVCGDLDGDGEAVFAWLYDMSKKAIALTRQSSKRNV